MAAELQGRVALVTGGGRGIGQAIALALATAGAMVVVSGRNATKLAETVAEITSAGYQAAAIPADIADSDAVLRLFQAIKTTYGPTDILVNNAGITASVKFTEMTNQQWDQIMQVNATGPFYCCRAAIPAMQARGWGRIVNIASIAALHGLAFSAAYSASKHAMLGLTRSLALELGRYGITANALCPGWVETDMLHESINNIVAKTGRTPEQARASILGLSGQQQAVTPEQVAAHVLRLVGSEGATINGEAIPIL